MSPPPGRRIVQISSCANTGGVVLFAHCDDGSVWFCLPFYNDVGTGWGLVVVGDATATVKAR